MSKVLSRLSNEYISLVLNEDASAELTDLKSGLVWRMGPVATQEDKEMDVGHNWLRSERSICEQYPGRFRGQVETDHIHFTVYGLLQREMGKFTCQYRLNGPWLEVEVLDIDDTLPNLMFPTPIESECLVLPSGEGKLIRKSKGRYDRRFYRFLMSLNMRWFGGLRGEQGWLAIVDEGHADAGVLQTQLCTTPVWTKSLGRWQGRRVVRYRFTTGGYVGMAKAFRTWAKENGCFKTLQEKMESCPSIANLIGGRGVSFFMASTFKKSRYEERCEQIPAKFADREDGVVAFLTYADVNKIIAECKTMGMKKGVFKLHGWINGGYDESYPNIWPPEPKLGTIEELRELCGEKDPYITCLHDNYQDIYPQSASFPQGVCIRRDGSFLLGGMWAGGQCYILNSARSLEAAQENWPRLASLGVRSLYADTVTAESFHESYERGHEQTRSQDEARKVKLMKFFCDQGLLLSSEHGMDVGVPYTAFTWTPFARLAGETVPLWSLVYHDCVVGHRPTWSPEEASSKPEMQPSKYLDNLLWGQAFVFGGFTAENWASYRELFKNTLYIDQWHERIGLSEMTGHRFLSEDYQVEQTEYANGAAIVVNYASEPRQVEGQTIPAVGYKIVG